MNTAHEATDDMADFKPLRTAECYYRHGCKGPCDQGDKPCQCPDACEQEDQSNSADATFIPFLLVMFLFFILACVSLWHVIARVYE